jgi:DGQHR domain-containing protein
MREFYSPPEGETRGARCEAGIRKVMRARRNVTCFVSHRDEDPKVGFQRHLDKARAQSIADYIDSGHGTIPTSIILSAQPEAGLRDAGKGKTIEFERTPRAFLILDGQHRVYGFSLAKTSMLRVPVVIYNKLNRKDESRLFIDINTKQRPVPNELLLDIKKLAEYENDTEHVLGELFDLFNEDPSSPLLGLMSPAAKASGKISRVTFYAALKPHISIFSDADPDESFAALAAYLSAFIDGGKLLKVSAQIVKPQVFRAVMYLFGEVAQKVQDRHGKAYTVGNFQQAMKPMFNRLRSTLWKDTSSYVNLHAQMSDALKTSFTL